MTMQVIIEGVALALGFYAVGVLLDIRTALRQIATQTKIS